MNNFLVIDVEADGPCPGLYSMISFGAVTWDDQEFYGECSPLFPDWNAEALAVSGITREQHSNFPSPSRVMHDFARWLHEIYGANRPVMWSDNPAFDWQFINWYFHKCVGSNPLGFSARRIGDYFAGTKKNPYQANKWKKLRRTKHTHNPVDDARGNMEALKTILSWR